MLKNFKSHNKGIAAIEFAIIFPIILLLLLGAVEVGYYIYKKQIVSRAVTVMANSIQAYPADQSIGDEAINLGSGVVNFGSTGHYICAKSYDTGANAIAGGCSEGEWDTATPNNVNEGEIYSVYLKAHSDYSSITGFGAVINALGLGDFEEDLTFRVGVLESATHGIELLTSGSSWEVPEGVTQIKATIIGGGGGGYTSTNSGGGGSGGVVVAYIDELSPGDMLYYSIGTAGASISSDSTPASNANGGETTFNGIVVGGGGGSNNGSQDGSTNGAGGTAAPDQQSSEGRVTSLAAFPGSVGAGYSGCNAPTGFSNYGRGGGGAGLCIAAQGAVIVEW